MARLIDADKLLEQIQWLEVDPPIFHDVWEEICSQPTVDAERHGRWIDGWICSECGEAFNTNGEAWNYCPNCGSKMDKTEERLVMPKADGSTIKIGKMDED